MLTKPSSVSKQFIECYPMAISEYKNDAMESSEDTFHQSLDNAFQLLEVRHRILCIITFLFLQKERLAGLMKILTRTITKQVRVDFFCNLYFSSKYCNIVVSCSPWKCLTTAPAIRTLQLSFKLSLSLSGSVWRHWFHLWVLKGTTVPSCKTLDPSRTPYLGVILALRLLK